MNSIPFQVILTEAILALLFGVSLASAIKRLGAVDSLLWSLVWVLRMLPSLGGAHSFQGSPSALAAYLGLQGLSAVALLAAFVRSDVRLSRSRWWRGVICRLMGGDLQSRSEWREIRTAEPERRLEPRLRIGTLAEATLLDGGRATHAQALLVDFSGAGMRLRMDRDVPAGSAIRVQSAGSTFVGEVLYCVPEDSGFALGLRIEDWAPDIASLLAQAKRLEQAEVRVREA